MRRRLRQIPVCRCKRSEKDIRVFAAIIKIKQCSIAAAADVVKV
jgi:hypothetical protein